MKRRFIIRDIITKKQKYLNGRKIEFKSISAARDFLVWLPFSNGNYYEIFDTRNDKVMFSFKINDNKRVSRR